MSRAHPNHPPAWLMRIGPALLLLPMLGVGGWWLAHPSTAAPPPQWTTADLPTSPAQADNGWALVTEAERELDLPEPLAAWIADEGLDTHQQRVEVLRFVATPAAQEALARVEAAAHRPAFADDCRPGARCGLWTWHEIHDAALVHVWAATLTNHHARAVELLSTLIRLDLAQLASPRSLLSLVIAVRQLDDALAKAEWLLPRLPETVVSPLRTAVAQVDLERMDLRPLVVSDYLVTVELLATQLEQPDTRRWPLDRHQTALELDTRFAHRHAAASTGDLALALGVGEPKLTASFAWWLSNPAGKLALDALHFDATDLTTDLEAELDSITTRRARLLHR